MSDGEDVGFDSGEGQPQDDDVNTPESSRPRRAAKPAGFYRKHASSIDNLIDKERISAQRAERRRLAQTVPENSLEFLQYSNYAQPAILGAEDEEEDGFIQPTSAIAAAPADTEPRSKRTRQKPSLLPASSEAPPRTKPAKRKAQTQTESAGQSDTKRSKTSSSGHSKQRKPGRPRTRPPEEPPRNPTFEDDVEGEVGGVLDLIEDEEYEETLQRTDTDDLLADLNYPVDVPIRDADVMNGTLAKTMEREGLVPEGHDEAWEKIKWNAGTYVNCDLRYYNLAALGKFDVVLIDPPWRLRGAQNLSDERTMFNNSRFHLHYDTLSKEEIMDLEVGCLSDRGFIFLWTINSQLQAAFECLNRWGYTYVDKITWIKKTNNANVHISQGFYLLHSSELCLVGVKRNSAKNYLEFIPKVSNDLIFAETRKRSQKPEQLYVLIERMFPGAKKIELFGRNHNIRPGWLTLGNQLGELYNWANDIVQCNHCKHLIHIGTVRFKHRHVSDSDICGRCWKAAKSNPSLANKFSEEDYFRLSNSNDEMVFHEYYECNGCRARPLWGIRFSCEQCADFDLCEECHDSRYVPEELTAVHTKDHRFFAVEIPHLAGGLPIHRLRCSGCDLFPIVGYRFKCTSCPSQGAQLSLCQKCFFAKKEPKAHKATHHMELVIEPQNAHKSKCDICGVKPIVGNRYKCNSCYNFDICEKCYTSKRPPPPSKVSHKPSHTYARITGDIDPTTYTGPVELARPLPTPHARDGDDEDDDNGSVSAAMMALVLGNQKKKSQMRMIEQGETPHTAAASSDALENSQPQIDGEDEIADDELSDVADEDGVDDEEEADFDLQQLPNDPSARFIMFNQKLRHQRDDTNI